MRLFSTLILSALLFAGTAGPLTAQDSADLSTAVRLFDEGTAHIEAGRYTQAIATFEQALDAGFENPALHYNAGIAHYRLDQIGPAVASFERARRMDPDNRMVLHNLSIAQARTRDQLSRLPDNLQTSILRALEETLGIMGLFFLGLLGYLAACLLIGLRVTGRPYTDWMRRGIWGSAALAVVGIGLALALSQNPSESPAAVIGPEVVSLHANPVEDQDPQQQVHEGLLVSVLGTSGDWTRIRLPNGVTGWVLSEHLLHV